MGSYNADVTEKETIAQKANRRVNHRRAVTGAVDKSVKEMSAWLRQKRRGPALVGRRLNSVLVATQSVRHRLSFLQNPLL